jgi:sugar lactone lactonase YvrE
LQEPVVEGGEQPAEPVEAAGLTEPQVASVPLAFDDAAATFENPPGEKKNRPIFLLVVLLLSALTVAGLALWHYFSKAGGPATQAAQSAPRRAQAASGDKFNVPQPFRQAWSRGQGELVALAGDRQGRLYALDKAGAEVRRFSYGGKAENPVKDPRGRLAMARSMAVDGEGSLYVSLGSEKTQGLDLVLKFDPAGRLLKQFRGSGRDDGLGESGPMAADGIGHLYVYDSTARSIQIFDLQGSLQGRIRQQTRSGQHSDIYSGLAASPEGLLYALHEGAGTVDRFSVDGEFLGRLDNPLADGPFDAMSLAADWDGNLWAGTRRSGRILRISPQGSLEESLALAPEMGACGIWRFSRA